MIRLSGPRCLNTMPNRLIHVALLVAVSFPSARAGDRNERGGNRRPVKVMIISTFGSKAQVWLGRLEPWRAIRVPGGSTAWARYLVEFGLQWETDAREIPPDWMTGYLGIDTTSPTQKPPREYRTEVFQLNEALLRKAYALSRDAPLADSAQAQAARAKFNHAPASQPSSVLQCDTASGDTWFSGSLLTQRARDWTRILTDGKGVFCTAQQEDNAIYEALKRGASARLLDLDRVAVLRAGSDFLQPYDGQSSADNLVNYAAQGGFPIALENLYRTGNPLVQQIVDHWRTWRRGVPAH